MTNGNFKHGLYATEHIDGVAKKVETFLQAPVDDLSQELALTRALLSQYMERLEDIKLDNLYPLNMLLSNIRQTVETISRVRNSTALTGQEVQMLKQGMIAVLQKYVSTDELPDALDDLRKVVRFS